MTLEQQTQGDKNIILWATDWRSKSGRQMERGHLREMAFTPEYENAVAQAYFENPASKETLRRAWLLLLEHTKDTAGCA